LDISSTEIRRRIRNGRSIRGLVPGPVEEYISSKNLYQE
jgi:nicotinate-nucleotide adenylyltransferase